MEKYHKIQSIFKRYPEGPKKGQFISGKFARPEFGYLSNNNWIGTEKIDGTNIRIHWDGDVFNVKGRTDNSQIPKFLEEKLMRMVVDMPDFSVMFKSPVTLYGEAFGAKIQKGGGNYISDGQSFILFDVKIDDFWLRREAVDQIAQGLHIKSVPVIFEGTLWEAIEKVENGFPSTIGTAQAEGMVLVPEFEMFSRNGERIITKIKTRDRFEN